MSFIYSAKSGLEANLAEWILRIPSCSRSHRIQRTLCPPSPQRVPSSPFLNSWRSNCRFRKTDKQMVVAMMGGCGLKPLRVDHSSKSGSWITKNTKGGPIGMRPCKTKGKLNLHITSRSVEALGARDWGEPEPHTIQLRVPTWQLSRCNPEAEGGVQRWISNLEECPCARARVSDKSALDGRVQGFELSNWAQRPTQVQGPKKMYLLRMTSESRVRDVTVTRYGTNRGRSSHLAYHHFALPYGHLKTTPLSLFE